MMIRLMTGLAVAAAGAAVLANAGRRTRRAQHVEEKAQERAEIARWADESGMPLEPPKGRSVAPDVMDGFVTAPARR